jgi:hypothetical protein
MQFAKKKLSTPCHSEARFIGEESVSLPAAKQQIPRAAMPRFGMTIRCRIFKYPRIIPP